MNDILSALKLELPEIVLALWLRLELDGVDLQFKVPQERLVL